MDSLSTFTSLEEITVSSTLLPNLLSIIVDATQVIKENSVNTVVSDDSDLLALQEIAKSYFGFSILSMADEYSVNHEKKVDT